MSLISLFCKHSLATEFCKRSLATEFCKRSLATEFCKRSLARERPGSGPFHIHADTSRPQGQELLDLSVAVIAQYLEGQGDLVRRLIMGISKVTIYIYI